MSLKKLTLTFALLLLLGVSVSAAQEELPSLRDLADANDVYIGAAVYVAHLSNPGHEEVLAREFNMLTPENEAKMCELQPTRGRFDFTRLDRLVEFAEANDMIVRGHTLLWHQCMPSWVANGDFSREEAIEIMRDHIYTVVGRYKGRIPMWDVVNEAIDDSLGIRETPWYNFIGEDYIELAFQFAHEADPDALLFYNDYGAEGMNPKANVIYDMVADFVERGVPIHGVGLQTHIELNRTDPGQYVSPSNFGQNIQRLGDLGLEVHITEVDVRYNGDTTDEILQEQAADYYRLMQTCLEHDACTTFVTWGVSDNFSWLRDGVLGNPPDVQPLLFTGDYEPKPAYFAVLDALARAAGMEPILTDEEVATLLDVEIVEPEVVELPEPTKSDPAQLAPDSVEGLAYYAPFPVSITLDGDLADWENIPTVTLGDTSEGANTESVTFATAADGEYLYFMADVRDPHIIAGFNDPVGGWYMEDSVEFYLNATGDPTLTSYETGVAQIGLMAANIDSPDELMVGGGNSMDSDVDLVAVETENGYRVEAAVPLVNDAWTIEPDHLAEIGYQVHLNGASAPDASQSTKLIWSAADTQDQSWQNPSVFGRLIFWDTSQ